MYYSAHIVRGIYLQITLIRHGKSLYTENRKLTCVDFKNWVDNYNVNGVFEETEYPLDTLQNIERAKIIMSSDLKRAMQSALLISSDIEVVPNPIFREADLPTPSVKLGLKCKPELWSIILRALWLCGYSKECESCKDAKIRASDAAQQLIETAYKYESVVLMGHGYFNMLIAKELQKKGWKGKKRTSAKHWMSTTYSY